jgi:3',5'-cyclic AMP phosphodiesterase CpdA
MRTIVHLSDLHFGSVLTPTLEPLLACLHAVTPDLVVVSGDLTQRAREQQFRDAQAYLARFPWPLLVVPGNHDIPLYDVVRRFVSPLGRYTRYVTSDLSPTFVDDEMAVVGINSARSLTFKGGTLGTAQVARAAEMFQGLPDHPVRIVVTHHPLDVPQGLTGVSVVRGAAHALRRFAACRVELVLTGHLHLVHRASASTLVPGYHAHLLGAGSATSTRARGEPNSFYVLRLDATRRDPFRVTADTYGWDAALNRFEVIDTRNLGCDPAGLVAAT